MSAAVSRPHWPARLRALAPLWALEFAVAQLAGQLVARAALSPLRAHPAGGEALFSEGSRLAMDLALRHTPTLLAGLRRAALPAALWSLFALLFALYPFVALASPRALTPRETLLRALHRAPAAVLLEGVSLLAHAAAFFCGLLTARALEPYAASLADARASVLLAPLAYLCTAGPLHALASTVMDRARARAAVSPSPTVLGALASLRGASLDVAHPRALFTLVPLRALAAVAVAALSLAELRALLALGPATLHAVLSLAALAHAGRSLTRALWIARLARDLRAAREADSPLNLLDEPTA